VGVPIGIHEDEKEALANIDLGLWYMTFFEEELRHLVHAGTPYYCNNCDTKFREAGEAISHLG
jgi:hypothetical protein